MKCKNCEHDNPRDAIYCNQCGVKIVKLLCKKCTTLNDYDAKYCCRCGNQISKVAKCSFELVK